MKKLSLLTLVLLICNVALAQDKNPSFIVKSGVNLPMYSSDWKGAFVGYQVGLAVDVPLTSKLSFQPEIDYFRSKSEWQLDALHKLTISTWNIPLVFNYKITEKLGVFAGPQVSYIAHFTRSRVIGDWVQSETTKPDRYLYEFNYGPTAGISYNFYKKFSIEAKYFMGMRELDINPGFFNQFTNLNVQKMSIANVSLTYKL
ncbi:hypothetical protein B0A58_03470 [Flavobacterium branchiophilum NBRC 15030 = ATCC 35035]|uniref:Outer membrane protein with beta-barrel domain n=1 Tax=Flavobacterium branchiophilum TaxID=55197 RepID=A0A543G2K2_9FLAO|nr:porin family protein [Flavobacterium branchiophilum]OXA79187.1 hypothetical protein B0A58_03470 [Flavobacterium branchiophilum NBRC 15030 = ATCC 35035]TQM40330.1 outer membrane protein with beta-barrel domain [Flavobacterium branchiophilum]GEM56539.1 hypothetical protein FB1_27600 [Flavobacterium branchiophilum NBRC 15030 = ATCC 35035]